jgi:hypothetical protein
MVFPFVSKFLTPFFLIEILEISHSRALQRQSQISVGNQENDFDEDWSILSQS